MIVPEVVDPSLDLPLLHSASYRNPEVHSPLPISYSPRVRQPRLSINAGTQVTTRTIPSYLGKLLLSQV
jgi:hypothetical protein